MRSLTCILTIICMHCATSFKTFHRISIPSKLRSNFILYDTRGPSTKSETPKKTDIVAITSKGTDMFDFSTSDSMLTRELFLSWEKQVDDVLADLKVLTKRDSILNVYTSILTKASPTVLDPLQFATFELFSGALIDNLVATYPEDAPITYLIEAVTDIHIKFIDQFLVIIDDGGSDGYSKSANQEYLCYQYAGLILKIYTRIINSLGNNYDISSVTQELRLNHWVDPIFKKLEELFPRFLTVNVDEKLEEIYESAFDKFLDRISIEMLPRYPIIPVHSEHQLVDESVSSREVTSSSSQPDPFMDVDKSIKVLMDDIPIQRKSTTTTPYPVWDYANFISKFIRNTIHNIDPYSVEIKIARMYQSNLSVRMRSIAKSLEKITLSNRIAIIEKELKMTEELLNIGHLVTAAVYAIWHIRYNIVGVKNIEDNTVIKDYLMPVTTTDFNKTIDCIPKGMREELIAESQLLEETYPYITSTQRAIVALCHAVRNTAFEEYRALIAYNSNSDDWPESRDNVYIAIVSTFIYQQLTSSFLSQDDSTTGSSKSSSSRSDLGTGRGSTNTGASSTTAGTSTKDQQILYENLIALAALDESIGVREPRNSVIQAYSRSIKYAILRLLTLQTKEKWNESEKQQHVNALKQKMNEVEMLLNLCLKLPYNSGTKCKQLAFQQYIEHVLSSSQSSSTLTSTTSSSGSSSSTSTTMNKEILKVEEELFNITPNSMTSSNSMTTTTTSSSSNNHQSVFKKLDSEYKIVAEILSIDLSIAKKMVMPLGLNQFDKMVGSMLMNADIAELMPEEMGKLLQEELYNLADDIMLDRNQSDIRVLFIGIAVIQSFLESLIEENRRLNYNNIDTILSKLYYVCNHPLIKLLQVKQNTEELQNILLKAIKATSTRIGSTLLVELIRAVESTRQRLSIEELPSQSSTSSSGWGGGGSTLSTSLSRDPKFLDFLQVLQTSLVKEYSMGAMRNKFKYGR